MSTTSGGERTAVGLLSVLFLKGDAALDLIYLTSCGVENGAEHLDFDIQRPFAADRQRTNHSPLGSAIWSVGQNDYHHI